MISKERVLAAVEFTPPDRIPADFHGAPLVIQRLFERYGLKEYLEVMERLGVDMIDIRGVVDPLWVGPMSPVREISHGVKENYLGFQMKRVQTHHGPVEEHCGYIFSNVKTLEELEAIDFSWPQVDWFDFSPMREELGKFQEYAVMASGASVFQHPSLVRGLDNLLADMLIQKDLAAALMDGYTDFYVKYFDAMFTKTQGAIDILRIADDLGMQDRPLISQALFKEFLRPRLQKLVDMAHSHQVKVMFHSCGSILEFIPDLIAIGIDILDPIQTQAKGMDPVSVKEKTKGRLCLHGSIDTQYTLPLGTPSMVEEEVRERIHVFGREGGFIIAPSHTAQPDVPLATIIALYDSIRKYG